MNQYEEKYKEEFDLLDSKYAAVGRHIKKLVDGTKNTPLILEGPAGVGKTSMVNMFMKQFNHTRYQVVAGKITPLALYMTIYHLRDKGAILVLDDTDTAMDNIDTLNILKAASDTKAVREVSWISSKPVVGYPLQFTTEGSIIILSNSTFANSSKSKKYEHLKALMSRSLHQQISDDNTEHKFIQLCYMIFRQGMLSHHDAKAIDTLLSYIEGRKETFKQFDLRTAVKLAEIYLEEPTTWQETADVLL